MGAGLPEWLDITKIGGLSVIILAIMQYIKSSIPEMWIKPATIAVGIVISILASYYIGEQINWIKAVVNGILAAVLADMGYSFLSKKPTTLTLPSREDQINKPEKR